ncbi:uncharacterized protein TNIN_268001 [Trichonephila inaurata madagascariensis]|uniref:Uncharacterized protein n=1 Tax=Trichonephila inaurata madagascariensis TaxID=2747483 RepID=A0A8X7C9R3_9ARAC|nr:uncharacterized protein TNIN_268001 [Trichonephila inaurata madagascariensis]
MSRCCSGRLDKIMSITSYPKDSLGDDSYLKNNEGGEYYLTQLKQVFAIKKGKPYYAKDKDKMNFMPYSVSLNSPLKDLKKPIIQTLSPTPSVNTILAIENSKRKRKRVQNKTGEVLTNENVLERLDAEESDHKNKFHQVNIKKDVKDKESFKVKLESWVERLSTGQEINHLNSLDK